jgi:paraquat-inducible protein A
MMSAWPPQIIACPDCDLLQNCVDPPYGGSTLCCRCQALLVPSRRESFDTTLAWAIAAAIMLALANAFPVVVLNVQAQQSATTLFETVRVLWQEDMPSLAAVVAVTIILAPALEAIAAIYVLLHLRHDDSRTRLPIYALRLFRSVEVWSMTEVFMLGALVALVKLEDYAELQYGFALWCLAAAMVCLAAMGASFNHNAAWERLERRTR